MQEHAESNCRETFNVKIKEAGFSDTLERSHR